MKKSPLSRMSGNGGSQDNRGYQHSPYGNRNTPNSNRINYDNFRSGNNCQSANNGCDFIPFETSSPVSQRSNSGNWQGSGGGYSGGYKNRRNSFYNSPGSNNSSPYSPFKHSPKQNNGRKNFQKSSQRKVDITAYLDFNSIFENPWAELEEQLNDSKSLNESKTFEDDSLQDSKVESSSLSPDSISGNLTEKSVDISDLSQDIKPSPEDL